MSLTSPLVPIDVWVHRVDGRSQQLVKTLLYHIFLVYWFRYHVLTLSADEQGLAVVDVFNYCISTSC